STLPTPPAVPGNPTRRPRKKLNRVLPAALACPAARAHTAILKRVTQGVSFTTPAGSAGTAGGFGENLRGRDTPKQFPVLAGGSGDSLCPPSVVTRMPPVHRRHHPRCPSPTSCTPAVLSRQHTTIAGVFFAHTPKKPRMGKLFAGRWPSLGWRAAG